ncbi:Hydroxymethylpyrimidine pyrophosphatase [Tropicimonas sediminicola]|uniref:Hydroxymethylpyrimidine pyrophosphatase n=2 Tax=Tropicimonas sediminicola TaxID=1031541 RepID=A0A239L0Y9_9RHOB|nr:Hydroxymethylpyrimidine pyrophosphatase [Tropicimonas sediminicola]
MRPKQTLKAEMTHTADFTTPAETAGFVFPNPYPAPLSGRRFVLATDLDGTFLGGTPGDRRTLYRWIEDNRATVGLIFVTGRDPAFIRDLCGSGDVPWPDYVIGDVGTTIAEVTPEGEISPIPVLEAEITRAWNGSGARVRELLADEPGLTLQPTEFRHRVSYDMDPARVRPSAHALVKRLGLEVLTSDDRFFDVLPAGVSKGPSLKRLIAHLGLVESRVLAAGDTLNDASMLALGIPAVAVGGSERRLLDQVGHLDHVHVAQGVGAAGIDEAIRVLDLH